ncbi:hypothetical protein ACFSTD_20360 [Novosphingobium colocasiae]
MDDGAPYSESLEYRDYDVERTRISGALSFDWRASDTTTAYVRGNWSQFDDHEYRRRTTFDLSAFEDDGPSATDGSMVSFDSADNDITIERDLKDRFERQRIRSVVLGSKTDTGTWKFDWSASYAKSTEKETFSLDPVRFAADFDDEIGRGDRFRQRRQVLPDLQRHLGRGCGERRRQLHAQPRGTHHAVRQSGRGMGGQGRPRPHFRGGRRRFHDPGGRQGALARQVL